MQQWVVVGLLTNGPMADAIRNERAGRDDVFLVPDLIDIEVVSALRSLTATQRIDAHRSAEFLAGLAALPAERYAHTPVVGRIRELRHNFTASDAAYIALAGRTGSVLYTCGDKLRSGHRTRVLLFTS